LPLKTASLTGGQKPNEPKPDLETTKPKEVSTSTGSKRETGNEVAGHQALDCHSRPQDQRQP